ncbi:Putative pyrophosphatase ppaX, partial [Candidatus Arthromitus sp. SFB-1]
MVGDSIYDIISGRDAGSKTCGVLYSFMKDEILKMDADYYIEGLMEILDII